MSAERHNKIKAALTYVYRRKMEKVWQRLIRKGIFSPASMELWRDEDPAFYKDIMSQAFELVAIETQGILPVHMTAFDDALAGFIEAHA